MEIVYIVSGGWVGKDRLGVSLSTIGWRSASESPGGASTPPPAGAPPVATSSMSGDTIRGSRPLLFPWQPDQSILQGFDYAIIPPGKNEGTPAGRMTAFPAAPTPLRVALSPHLDEVFNKMVEQAVALPGGTKSQDGILQKILCQFPSDEGQSSGEQEALDQTWSACVAGLSQQGHPIANEMCVGLSLPVKIPIAEDGAPFPEKSEFVPVPIFKGYGAAKIGRIADGKNEFAIRYEGGSGLVVRVSSVAYSDCKAVRTFIGTAANYDASAFRNWRADAPFQLGSYLNLYSFAAAQFARAIQRQGDQPAFQAAVRSGLTPEVAGQSDEQRRDRAEGVITADRKLRQIAGLWHSIEMISWLLGRTNPPAPALPAAPQPQRKDNTDLRECSTKLDKEIERLTKDRAVVVAALTPLLALANDRADLGLRQSFRARGLADAKRFDQTLAHDVFRTVSLGANVIDDDIDALLGQAAYLLTGESGLSADSWFKIWFDAISSTVKEIENGNGESGGGAYGNLHSLILLATGDGKQWPNAEKPVKCDFTKALEELDLLLTDEVALPILFVQQWDGFLKPSTLQANFERLTGAKTMSACRSKLGEHVQQTGLVFRSRYDEGLAGSFLKDAAGNLNRLGDPLASPAQHALLKQVNQDLESKYRQLVAGGSNTPWIRFEVIYAKAFLFGAIATCIDVRRIFGRSFARYKDMPFLDAGNYDEVRPEIERGMYAALPIDPASYGIAGTLIGASESSQASKSPGKWHPLPPPLLIPVNVVDGYDDAEYSGILALGRRVIGEDSAVPWCVLNVGEIAVSGAGADTSHAGRHHPPHEYADELADDVRKLRKSKGLANFGIAPAPLKIVQSWDVSLSTIEYRGQPLGVHLWRDFEDQTYENHVKWDPKNEIYLKLDGGVERWQIVEVDDAYFRGMGPVPGLRYDKKWNYEFLLVPIHNSGALPPDFYRDGTLKSASQIDAWLRGSGDGEVKAHRIIVTDYKRSVPVGQVRLAQPGVQAALPEGLGAIRELCKYEEFRAPLIPDGVTALASDLLAGGGDGANPDVPIPSGLSRPAQTVVLWEIGSSSPEAERYREFSFALRPPATEIQNWSIWQSSLVDTPGMSEDSIREVLDCLADMQRVVHELTADVQLSEGEIKPALQKMVNDLLDDPAVVGVCVRIRAVFPHYGEFLAGEESMRYLPFSPADPGGYAESLDDSNWPPSPELYSNLRKAAQTLLPQAITVKLTGEKDAVPRIAPGSASAVEILVPKGMIVEVEILPCIAESTHADRFAIYEKRDAQGKGDLVRVEAGIFGIASSATRLWVEGVPGTMSDASNVLYLTPEEAWNALQLSSVGTQMGEPTRVARLEVSIRPGFWEPAKWEHATDLQRRWCYVGEAIAEIQPWIWKGIPEGPGWTSAPAEVLQKLFDGDPDGAHQGSSEFLSAVTQVEVASYGERPHSASLEQSAPVNFANWYGMQARSAAVPPPSPALRPPPILIYQDRGEQAAVPKYYRVLIRLRCRYAGLGGKFAQEVWGAKEWTDVKTARTTEFRRIAFRGRLAKRVELPRIKMIVPLLEESEDGGRPGFIVLTRDTLLSPWNQMRARVAWAEVEIGDPAKGPVTRMALPEFGPDPLTAGDGFDWTSRSETEFRLGSDYLGSAFGLTFEREAANPFFPNAGVHFNAPFSGREKASVNGDAGAPMVNLDAFNRHDWMAKMEFRWEIQPAGLMNNPLEMTASEYTQPWQVRLLAPLRKLGDSDLRQLSFSVGAKGGNLKFHGGGGGRIGTPRPPTYDQNRVDPDASPAAALLFVVWSKVPDFLNPEPSKVVHSIFFISSKGDPLQIYVNGQAAALNPRGGNFLLLFGRQGDLQKMQADLESASAARETSNGEDWSLMDVLLDEFLFPGATNYSPNVNRDARAMIVRCSAVIYPK